MGRKIKPSLPRGFKPQIDLCVVRPIQEKFKPMIMPINVAPVPNKNAPSALQKPPTKVFKVGKVPIKRKMMEQTPVAMANATTSAKYAPVKKSRKSNRL